MCAILLDLSFSPLLFDDAEVLLDLAVDASFFPSFALCSSFLRSLIFLPTTLGQNPAFATGALNEKNLTAVVGKRYDSCYKALAS